LSTALKFRLAPASGKSTTILQLSAISKHQNDLAFIYFQAFAVDPQKLRESNSESTRTKNILFEQKGRI